MASGDSGARPGARPIDVSSKMRRHGGNLPSLPQTKQCPYCDAKYTRTTHLNRHMKTHTREGLHVCNMCKAEFTRSDLLTRHKKSCANRNKRAPLPTPPASLSPPGTSSPQFALRKCLLDPLDPALSATSASSDGAGPAFSVDEILGDTTYSGNLFDGLFSEIFPLDPQTAPQADPSFSHFMFDPQPLQQPTMFDVNGPETQAELDHYEYLFYTEFLPQMPICHVTVFSSRPKPVILMDAMRACGALYVKTSRAGQFTRRHLSSSRETLAREFARVDTEEEQIDLILAVSLLQMIGLFHHRRDERAVSNLFHGMLVMLIRRAGLILRNYSWVPLEFAPEDPASVDAAWRAWIAHETAKRGLYMSYLHDMTHVVSFALPACYMPSEFTLHLPCDGLLWAAQSAQEWLAILQRSSPYGTLLNAPWTATPQELMQEGLRQRLRGLPLQYTLDVLRSARSDDRDRERVNEVVLNTMAGLIVLKVLLADVYGLCTPGGWPPEPKETEERDGEDVVYASRYALHNWLMAWLAGPEAPREEDGKPAFYKDALPFYWLAQITLVACQERMPPFAPGGAQDTDVRYDMLNRWLKSIRKFLSGQYGKEGADGGPTLVWDEMMKIKLEGYRTDPVDHEPFKDGVLGFFSTAD